MKPVCLYSTLHCSLPPLPQRFFITLCIYVLTLLALSTSSFLFVPFLTLCLSTSFFYRSAFILPLARVSHSFLHIALISKMSSFHTYILPSYPSPTSFHPSLSLLRVTAPSLPPSRDNYYKPCEDQLVFKQLNKQGLVLLTVTIQQQSSETVE